MADCAESPCCGVCERAPSSTPHEDVLADLAYLLDDPMASPPALCAECVTRVPSAADFVRRCRHASLRLRWLAMGKVKEEGGWNSGEVDDAARSSSEDEKPLRLLKPEPPENRETHVVAEAVKPRKKVKLKKKKKMKREYELKVPKAEEPEPDRLESTFTLELQMTDQKPVRRKKYSKEGARQRREATGPDGQRVVKEGRRVVETDEYVVIRLTVDEVRAEMAARACDENYLSAPHRCEYCVKGFNYEDVLRAHRANHSLEAGGFECELCRQRRPSAVSLRGHMKSHTTRYKCKQCGAVRLSRQHLLEHAALAHAAAAAARTYTCRCGFGTLKRTMFQKHARTHAPAARVACDKCGKLFKNMETLRAHQLQYKAIAAAYRVNVTPGGSIRTLPDDMPVVGVTPGGSVRHVKGSPDSSWLHTEWRAHRCGECPARFARAHVAAHAAPAARRFYCVECDVVFRARAALTAHLRRARAHRGAASAAAEVRCESCARSFASAAAAAAHAAWAHEGRREHACAACPRRYGTRDGLRAHRRAAHPPTTVPAPAAAAHACHHCAKTFRTRGVLVKHLRVHTGERPYECDECGQRFAQAGTRATHVRLVHRRLPRRKEKTVDNAQVKETVSALASVDTKSGVPGP